MSKTITIPSSMNPYEVTVNNTVYSYPAGETVEVPDEVAAVIENNESLEPKANEGRLASVRYFSFVAYPGKIELSDDVRDQIFEAIKSGDHVVIIGDAGVVQNYYHLVYLLETSYTSADFVSVSLGSAGGGFYLMNLTNKPDKENSVEYKQLTFSS